MLQAVIFDIDGVLVDSYHAHFRSWQRVGAEHGVAVTEDEFAATFGRTSRDIIEILWAAAGRPIPGPEGVRRLDAQKEALYRGIVRADFPAMPGAAALLDELAAAGVAVAVGSSGPPENVELVLDRFGPRRFAAYVTGYDVRRGKPDPDVFLIAARRLDLPPDDCVVVEDAVAGIQATRAAGMKCVGLVSTGHTEEELAAAEPDLLVCSLGALDANRLRKLWAG